MTTQGWTATCPVCKKTTLEMEKRSCGKRGECLDCGFFIEETFDHYHNRDVKRMGFIVKPKQLRNTPAVIDHWFESPARIHFGWVNWLENNQMKNPCKLELVNSLHKSVKIGDQKKVKHALSKDPSLELHFPGDIAKSRDPRFDMTLLHAVALSGNVLMAELVDEFGSRSNEVDIDGATPLHYAAELNHVDMVKWLLDKTSKPNLQDRDSDTALHAAARQSQNSIVIGHSHVDVMKLMLANGVDGSIRNNDGKTALDIMKEADADMESRMASQASA